ncbi:MAG: CheR family methyltransferase [Myxococcaceae bacterium]
MTALERLFGLIEGWTGICLERGGTGDSLRRFAAARAKLLGLPSVEDYAAQLEGPLREERALLVEAVTVNFTWFYRDAEQLEAIEGLLRQGFPPGKALDLWVPGCATGEDAYTLAMLAQRVGREAFVLGTDLSPASLSAAAEGRYGAWSTRELPTGLWPFFRPEGNGAHRVAEGLRRRVSFEQHNLIDPPKQPPGGGGWDLVLCRNVLIYFSRAGAEGAQARLGASLSPGGWLLLGSSEGVFREPAGLRALHLGRRPALHRPIPRAPAPGLAFAAAAPAVRAPGPSTSSVPVAAPSSAALSLVAEGGGLLSASPEEAIARFARARELDPLCVEAHLHLGIALHLLGDALSAAASLRASLLLDPALWPAAFYLALSYDTLGQGEDAQREYRRVLELSGAGVNLAVRGVLGDVEAWRADVLALSRRRTAPRRG